ncbi:MAG: molecular chaperone Tir [Deltaproteobacteria bacterium]|nr:MAG: molecular chaperone Tir [Deltaproteobacteria bacterium]
MENRFERVKAYLFDMDVAVIDEIPEEEIVIIADEENGIMNMVVDCEAPIVILEQMILDVPAEPGDLFSELLKMNRTLVHGAFVLDESGKRVIFRDTLQLENLDRNELEASIHALSLALSEYGETLLGYMGK